MKQLNLAILHLIMGVGLALGAPREAALFESAPPVLAQTWLPVRSGLNFGISGMALAGQVGQELVFLVVHDSKGGGEEGRLALVRVGGDQLPQYVPLNWPAPTDLPRDLEALTQVPTLGETHFMAMSSAGKVYHLQWNPSSAAMSLLGTLELPEGGGNDGLEGFALQEIAGQLLAVWAHRGGEREPGVIYWGLLDLSRNKISPLGSAKLQVPLATSNLRHISDLKVDAAGIVYITSATDPGNDGPFQSAVYIAGFFDSDGKKSRFQQNRALVPWYSATGHKVEAIELVPGAKGGVFLGTDDENSGSSIGVERHLPTSPRVW